MDGSAFHNRPEPLRALVADGHAINRFVLARMLELRGCTVTEARTGRDAVELAQSEAFGLIMLELTMPGLDGVEAVQLIRRPEGRSADALTVAVAADIPTQDRPRLVAAGFDRMLEKPLRMDSIAAVVDEAAEKRATAPPT